MKRKSGKALLDVREGVSVVHLNVDSGYLTYIEEGEAPQVKNVVLKGRQEEPSEDGA